jgi:integrase
MFCTVDLNLMERTVKDHAWRVRRFLDSVGKHPLDVSINEIRGYLFKFKDRCPSTYSAQLKSLKVFFRDFMQMEYLVQSFRFPSIPFTLKDIPSKNEVQTFYHALKTPKAKTLYLFYATSGLRKREVLSLVFDNINLETRMIVPTKKLWSTKNTWITFINEEAKQVLMEEYLPSRTDSNPKVFPFAKASYQSLWRNAEKQTGIHITPQRLRDFFCCEMGRLGVPDRYVDAFCGRVPKSILARHYTDYNPERLKRIYDKANLKLFS